MMIRGAAGVVSDGGLRDSPEIAKLPFPTYCQGGSAPTNLIKHHAVDLNVPIGCGGVPVFPGDIMRRRRRRRRGDPGGDRRGDRADAAEQDLFETFVTEKVREGAVDLRPLPAGRREQAGLRGLARRSASKGSGLS